MESRRVRLLTSLMAPRFPASEAGHAASFKRTLDAIASAVKEEWSQLTYDQSKVQWAPGLAFERLLNKCTKREEFVAAFKLLKADWALRSRRYGETEPHGERVAGAVFGGTLTAGMADLAVEFVGQAADAGLYNIGMRHCREMVNYCSVIAPRDAALVWKAAKLGGEKRGLGSLAFAILRCYLDNDMIEEARAFRNETRSGNVLLKISPGVEGMVDRVLEGKSVWRKDPLSRQAMEMSFVT